MSMNARTYCWGAFAYFVIHGLGVMGEAISDLHHARRGEPSGDPPLRNATSGIVVCCARGKWPRSRSAAESGQL
jgi:hypothetical protein